MEEPRKRRPPLVRRFAQRTITLGVAVAALLGSASSAYAAAVCYQLPFPNPDLADGWGATAGRTNPHRGVDFPQPANTPIPAVADGTVRVVTSTGCLGNVIVLEHADGMFSGYAHLIARSPLAEGAVVARGQTIGNVGTTGSCTTGNHLHLTMSAAVEGYVTGTTVDPYKYIVDHRQCGDDGGAPITPSTPDDHDYSAGEFTFSNDGPQAGETCVNVDEPGDPHSWTDNYFCSKTDVGMKWSYRQPIAGMRCTNTPESAEHDPSIWADNYLCLPPDSPYTFTWSSAGPLPDQDCVRWYEGSDLAGSWSNNHLCVTSAMKSPAPGSTNGTGVGGRGLGEDDVASSGCSIRQNAPVTPGVSPWPRAPLPACCSVVVAADRSRIGSFRSRRFNAPRHVAWCFATGAVALGWALGSWWV